MFEMRNDRFRKKQRCLHIDVQKCLKIFRCKAGTRSCATDVGVVYENINAAQLSCHFVFRSFDDFRVAQSA